MGLTAQQAAQCKAITLIKMSPIHCGDGWVGGCRSRVTPDNKAQHPYDVTPGYGIKPRDSWDPNTARGKVA